VTDTADLARRLGSDDVNEAGIALGDLIALGHAATPALLEAAAAESAGTRVLAMEGLARVADPGSEPVLRRALEDPDGRVRSGAAVALNRIGASGALEALAATLDDWPDELHGEMSRSAYELAGSGPRALPIAVGLLASDDWATRAKGAWITRRIATQAGGDHDGLARIVEGYTGRDRSPDEQHAIAEEARRWLEQR
jgi:HEAT repeat protein